MVKYILVTGGVISGLGKGVVSSSIGCLLKCAKLNVSSIKIDPYINIDAGTFSPYEHGEVFVLDDGGEVDLDLGNYERFLDVTLRKDNNLTTGKIYQSVISKERRGDYLGKTVQVVPHITKEIQERIEKVAQMPVDSDNRVPDVCVIELGGTIGDIESMAFVEALRQFQFNVGKENFLVAHVSLVPEQFGEQKTKPTQSSVRELRGLGISPDLILIRSQTEINEAIRNKIAMFGSVKSDEVLSVPNIASLYGVPILLEQQGLLNHLRSKLKLTINTDKGFCKSLSKWRELASKQADLKTPSVTIAIVGKYTKLADSYASVVKALEHSALACGFHLNISYIDASAIGDEAKLSSNDSAKHHHEAWQSLCSCDGVIIPGGFGNRGVEGKVAACRWARTNGIPVLGICLGFQCQVIEYARNVLHLDKANSTEFDAATEYPVIIDMPEHTTGEMGGTQRLGSRATQFVYDESVLKQLYGRRDVIHERHRHRYEVNPNYVERLEAAGIKFVGKNLPTASEPCQNRMEIMELPSSNYYVGLQCHPEFLSRPLSPSPPFVGLILAATKQLGTYLSNNCRLITSVPSVERRPSLLADKPPDPNVSIDTPCASSTEDLARLTAYVPASLFRIEFASPQKGRGAGKSGDAPMSNENSSSADTTDESIDVKP